MKFLAHCKIKAALCQFKAIIDSMPSKPFSSAVDDSIAKSNFIFSQEKKRQSEDVGRVEKINVKVCGIPQETSLVMNQNISSPYDCAKHISESVVQRAALAQVDDLYWDMHAPLTTHCTLRFLSFRDADPQFLNRSFWRSCCVMLGAVVMKSFKDDIPVHLHSFPSPNVRSGSFLYDVALGLKDWTPTKDELRVLSAEMVALAHAALPFEKLLVSKAVAQEIFEANPYKSEQIPDIAAKSPDGQVTLYRVGTHIEVSRGPLMANTNFLGRCSVTAVHKLSPAPIGLYRFQGVALPKGLMLNHFAFGILEERARKLNPSRLPNEDYEAAVAQ